MEMSQIALNHGLTFLAWATGVIVVIIGGFLVKLLIDLSALAKNLNETSNIVNTELKPTLKELNQISIYCPWVKNIIQNVVFIGGATCLPKKKKSLGNLRELVAGRVINVYNPNDEVLTSIYKTIVARDPFGVYPIELDGVKVENYDFSDLKIGHVEYWDYTNIIIKKINLF